MPVLGVYLPVQYFSFVYSVHSCTGVSHCFFFNRFIRFVRIAENNRVCQSNLDRTGACREAGTQGVKPEGDHPVAHASAERFLPSIVFALEKKESLTLVFGVNVLSPMPRHHRDRKRLQTRVCTTWGCRTRSGWTLPRYRQTSSW